MSRRIGFISTYQPTRCGLATFTASLLGALTSSGEVKAEVLRLRAGHHLPTSTAPEVVAELDTSVLGGTTAAAAAMDAVDVAVVQFEYGVFGGEDGEQAVRLLERLRVPAVVVLHTVLGHPSPHQRQVLEQVAHRADRVVVMTDTARRWLLTGYRVDPAKVVTIPHGAAGPAHRHDRSEALAHPTAAHCTAQPIAAPHLTAPDATARHTVPVSAPTILTWGLIGPGKGIEWGIDAIARLGDLDPAPRYVVAGQTHPQVRQRDGEAYRHALQRRAADRGVSGRVLLDDRYRDQDALDALIRRADVVLLPYDSLEQISSGVLIEAVAAGIPVVATRFPHAVELLRCGAGLLVDQQSPDTMASALRTILTDRRRAAGMRSASETISGRVSWDVVATSYRQVIDELSTIG